MDRSSHPIRHTRSSVTRDGLSAVRCRLTRGLAAGLVVVSGMASGRVAAQTNTAKTAPSNRCLLVVDTSRAMQRRVEATLKVVQDLLLSGLNQQLQRGDTIGLWTFDETLRAGKFPLQTWSPEARREIAARALTFLKAQKYEKQADFNKTLTALSNVVERSERLTVILISSGDEQVRGTPYDGQIAAFYRRWHDEQQKARMPFVTVLRGQDGRWVDCALNTPPWPVQIPAPPRPAQSGEPLQAKLQQALRGVSGSNAAPPKVVEKTAQPTNAPAAVPEPVSVKAEAPVAPAASSGSNKVAAVAAPSAQVVVTQAVPAVPTLGPTQVVSKPIPAPAPAVESKAEVVKTPQPRPPEPPPPKPEPAPPVPAPVAQPKPVAIEPPKPPPVTEPKPLTTLAAPTAKEVAGKVSTNAPGTILASSNVSTVASRPPPTRTPPAQAAAATPAENPGWRNVLWIAALVVVFAAAGCILLRLRRLRTAPQGSLITRSYERVKKP